jgi:hypothetical protein
MKVKNIINIIFLIVGLLLTITSFILIAVKGSNNAIGICLTFGVISLFISLFIFIEDDEKTKNWNDMTKVREIMAQQRLDIQNRVPLSGQQPYRYVG